MPCTNFAGGGREVIVWYDSQELLRALVHLMIGCDRLSSLERAEAKDYH